jgi:hypothetical protein
MEARLFALEFSVSGSLYYRHDLPAGLEGIDLDLGTQLSCGKLCMGPETSLALWCGRRKSLDVFRGPCKFMSVYRLRPAMLSLLLLSRQLTKCRQDCRGSCKRWRPQRARLAEVIWTTTTSFAADAPRSGELSAAKSIRPDGMPPEIPPLGTISYATIQRAHQGTHDPTPRSTAKQRICLGEARDHRSDRLAALHHTSSLPAGRYSGESTELR